MPTKVILFRSPAPAYYTITRKDRELRLAAYATVKLGQPYPVESLSETAITVILGGGILKVVQNIFEHNNGFIFGNSEKEENNNDTD